RRGAKERRSAISPRIALRIRSLWVIVCSPLNALSFLRTVRIGHPLRRFLRTAPSRGFRRPES
ncbi:MAG TPA: hypothetical protein VF318_03555, partial [Dehalococcoidales bacterium]